MIYIIYHSCLYINYTTSVLPIHYTAFPRILWPSALFKAEIKIAVPIIINTLIIYISANYVQCRVWSECPGQLHEQWFCIYTENSDLLIFCYSVTSFTNEKQIHFLKLKNFNKEICWFTSKFLQRVLSHRTIVFFLSYCIRHTTNIWERILSIEHVIILKIGLDSDYHF